MARELGMTVAEMSARMSTREFAEHMVYDRLMKEAHQEIALDREFAAHHARIVSSLRGGR